MNKWFNILMGLYFLCSSIANALFSAEDNTNVLWDKIFSTSPFIGMAGAIFLAATFILWGSAMTKYFWNRFVSDVFNLRAITFNESLSIVLVVAILGMNK